MDLADIIITATEPLKEPSSGFWSLLSPMNIVIGVLSICLIIAIFFLVVRKLDKKRYFNITVGGLIFLGGLLLYLYGFNYEGTRDSVMALWIRATMSSLEMFISHSDLLEVSTNAKDSPIYMTLFSLTHCMAILFSAYIAISYLGLRILSHSRYFQYKLRLKKRDTMNVFMTFNDNAYNLAKDWYDTDRKILTVFVNEGVSQQNEMSRFNIGKVIDLFSSNTKKDLIEKIDDVDGILINTHKALIDVDINEVDLLDKIDAKRLKTLFGKMKAVNIFFISNDWDKNITSAVRLCEWIKMNQSSDAKIEVFCEADRDPMNLALTLRYEKPKLYIIDTSFLSVSSLKKQVDTSKNNDLYTHYKFHPVNFVDIDSSKGLAITPFECLIIGFGSTGREMLKFLYEFGQLPIRKDKKIVSAFKGYVVDKNMEILHDQFIQKYPQMQAVYSNIDFMNYDYNGHGFWNFLNSKIETLNYIVVAEGGDESGMRLAINISELAQRNGRSNDKLRIFVRSYTQNKENKLQTIANDYSLIDVFGKNTEVYSKSLFDITSEKNTAKIFEDSYNKVYGKINQCIKKDEKPFDKGSEATNILNDTEKIRLKAQKNLRQYNQNLSNVYHIYTKMKLAGEPFESSDKRLKDKVMQFLENVETDNFSSLITEKGMSIYPPSFDAIAQCEHLRWVASHALLGYTPMSKTDFKSITCNEFLKTQACMTDWSRLDELTQEKNGIQEYKAYDRLTIYVTFKLVSRKLTGNKIDSYNNEKKELESQCTPLQADTINEPLPQELIPLIEGMAKNVHDIWASTRIKQGWKYGPKRDDEKKLHPCLVEYEKLPEYEKELDRQTAMETIRCILNLEFKITKD